MSSSSSFAKLLAGADINHRLRSDCENADIHTREVIGSGNCAKIVSIPNHLSTILCSKKIMVDTFGKNSKKGTIHRTIRYEPSDGA